MYKLKARLQNRLKSSLLICHSARNLQLYAQNGILCILFGSQFVTFRPGTFSRTYNNLYFKYLKITHNRFPPPGILVSSHL